MRNPTDLNRVQADAALGNSPLWFGEWGLPTQFNATDDFLLQWADAQKLAYSQGAGWIVSSLPVVLSPRRLLIFGPATLRQQFWNFKVEISEAAGDLARQW